VSCLSDHQGSGPSRSREGGGKLTCGCEDREAMLESLDLRIKVMLVTEHASHNPMLNKQIADGV
jgi:hypothetical protein